MNDSERPRPQYFNTNSYISIGMVIILFGGFASVLNGISSAKTEMTSRFDKLELRVTALESQKNSWSAVQMFQWSVHLQQLNNDPKKLSTEGLKVPEPEIPK